MNKQNLQTSNLSFILLLVVILGCLSWLAGRDDHATTAVLCPGPPAFPAGKVRTLDH